MSKILTFICDERGCTTTVRSLPKTRTSAHNFDLWMYCPKCGLDICYKHNLQTCPECDTKLKLLNNLMFTIRDEDRIDKTIIPIAMLKRLKHWRGVRRWL